MRNVIPQLIAPKAKLTSQSPDAPPLVACPVTVPGIAIPNNMQFNSWLLAFALDDAERAEIAKGADLYVTQVMQDRPLNSVILSVGKEGAAAHLQLEIGTPDVLAKKLAEAKALLLQATTALLAAIRDRAEAEAVGLTSGETFEELEKAEAGAIVAMDQALDALSRARLSAGVGLEHVP